MEPITRKELFMAKAAGQNVNVPEPITREEKYLKQMADNSVSEYFGESTEALFDQRVEFEDPGEETYSYGELPGVTLGLVIGEKYHVKFGDVEFEATATEIKGGPIMLSSDESATAEEYFRVYEVVGMGLLSFECSPVRETADIKIEKLVIRTIDPKFLPVDYLNQLIAEVKGK